MSVIFRRVLCSRVVTQPSNTALWLRLRAFSDAVQKWTDQKIGETVKKDKVVVFMKGVPSQPMCGFSNAVVQILRMHGVDKFTSFNILDDEELRSRIKEFSEWPTIPQVYIGGEFVGGCDIMIKMHQEGDLIGELKKVGIDSALAGEAEKKDS
ncbi:glutaredoxin-related protein 5, mitochondrial [Nematostella vectensis]|uniref:glutaredoxin-related protein 5, mitochondrial n=1 Tax=Nematostella vectensis TaxID=45351 RepID=UPI0020770E95|nr:glutaredoxin-related protein 5, mitochondrial [Nematostella vectensis]